LKKDYMRIKLDQLWAKLVESSVDRESLFILRSSLTLSLYGVLLQIASLVFAVWGSRKAFA